MAVWRLVMVCLLIIFLYLLSETVRNVILTKFASCADSDLLCISKLRPYITTWHRIPTSYNANSAVRNISLLHNTPLRGALGVDHVLTKYASICFGNTTCKQSSQKCLTWIVLLCKKAAPRAGLKPMQPMQLHWTPRLWGPTPWWLFIFARYTKRLRIQQKRHINFIVNKERSRQNQRISSIVER